MWEELRRELKKWRLLSLGMSCILTGLLLLPVSWYLISLMDGVAVRAGPEGPEPLGETQRQKEAETDKELNVQLREHLSDLQEELEAEAVHIYDIKAERTLFGYQEQKRLPLASITKLMTALVAVETLPEYMIIELEKDFLEHYGNSGLLLDDHWRVTDLVDIALISSVNDAAYALAVKAGQTEDRNQEKKDTAEKQFVSMMNKKARELGMNRTVFFNATGLDSNKVDDGARGSAYDISLLLAHIIDEQPELLKATTRTEKELISALGSRYVAINTNPTVDQVPDILASKTGFTSIAGGNLAIVFRPEEDRPLAVTVLGSTFRNRYTDILLLVDQITEYYNSYDN